MRPADQPVIVPVLGFVLTTAIVVYTAAGLTRDEVWRASYYSRRDLSGFVHETWTSTPDFSLGLRAAVPSFPADGFSARFESCLQLEVETRVLFALGSDDGSRLAIDGVIVLDQWSTHGIRYVNSDVVLPAGAHHVRVDYFEDTGGALLNLKTGFGTGEMREIPNHLLTRPVLEDGAWTCP